MIVKLLLLGIVLFAVYLIFFKKNREKNIKEKNDDMIETMIACPTCGTYIAKDDSILSNGKNFCSKECLQ